MALIADLIRGASRYVLLKRMGIVSCSSYHTMYYHINIIINCLNMMLQLVNVALAQVKTSE